jgi:hypothetical protein
MNFLEKSPKILGLIVVIIISLLVVGLNVS